MNLNFIYGHGCGSVKSFKVGHLTLCHHRSAGQVRTRLADAIVIGASHNGLAADAYSYRTRGRSGSLPGRRKPEFDMEDEPGSPAADQVRKT
jgi:hypothetical protein